VKGKIAAALLIAIAACAAMAVFSTTAVAVGVPAELTLVDNITKLPLTRGNVPRVFELKVKNVGVENIDNIKVRLPTGWSALENAVPITGWTWENIGADNFVRAAAGYALVPENTLTIYFRSTTPPATENQYIILATGKGPVGDDKYLRMEIDATAPTLTLTVTPDNVRFSSRVDLRIVASERVSIDNVYVQQNGVGLADARENYRLGVRAGTGFTTADNITFTGFYTTLPENVSFENLATIFVEGDNVKDRVGNPAVDYSIVFRVDSYPPVIPSPLTMPADNALLRKPFEVTLTTRDNRGGSIEDAGGLRVEVYQDEKILLENAVSLYSPAGYWSYVIRPTTDGTIKIGFKIFDGAGNKWENLVYRTYRYDSKPPTVAPRAPADRWGVVRENVKRTWADNIRGIEATVTDPSPSFGLATITTSISPDPGSTENSVPENGLARRFLTPAVMFAADTLYTFTVVATDNAGNSITRSWTLYVDNTRPTVTTALSSVTVDGVTQTFLPSRVKGESFKIVGGGSGFREIYVRFYDAGTLVRTVAENEWAVDNTGSYEVTILKVPEGKAIEVRVQLMDESGLASPENSIGTFLVDRTAPAISITEPTPDYTTTDIMVTVRGSVVDTVSGLSTLVVRGASIGFAEVTPGTYSFSTTVMLVEGPNTIDVVATDALGNSSTTSIKVHRTVAPWALIAVIVAIVAVLLAVIAVLRRR